MFDEKVLNDENEELNAEFDNNDGYYENYQNNALNKNTNVNHIFLNDLLKNKFRISEPEQAIKTPKISIQRLNWMEPMN